MKTTIPKKWWFEKNAGIENILLYAEFKYPRPKKMLELLIKDNRLNPANWLIIRIMSRKQYLKYAIFAVEQVSHIYEKIFLDDKLSVAIEATKKCIKRNSKYNRNIAYHASEGIYYNTYGYGISGVKGVKVGINVAIAAHCVVRSAREPDNEKSMTSVTYAVNYASLTAMEYYSTPDKRLIMPKIINYGMDLLKNK